MTTSVTVVSPSRSGDQQITIEKTGPAKANIDVQGGQDEDVENVRANPEQLTLVCQLDAMFFTADISVVVRKATGSPPVATISVSHAPLESVRDHRDF